MIKPLSLFTALLLCTTPVFADTPRIIDVRTADEYQQSHVQGAINIPYDQIASRIAAIAPDNDVPIVLYCRSGRRSGIAERALRQMGYTHIQDKGALENMGRSGYVIEIKE